MREIRPFELIRDFNRRIMLNILMLLITTLSFGQSFFEKEDRLFLDKWIEVNKTEGNKEQFKTNQERLPVNIRHNAQKSIHKSSQASKHRLDSLVIHYWDQNTNQWIAFEKNETTFNVNGNLIIM